MIVRTNSVKIILYIFLFAILNNKSTDQMIHSQWVDSIRLYEWFVVLMCDFNPLHTIQTFYKILWDSFKRNTKYGTILMHSISSFLLIMITPRVTIFGNVDTPAMSAHGVQTPVRLIEQILRLVNPSYSRGKHFRFSVKWKQKSKCTSSLV